jgi:hypothetical protein
MSRSEKITRIKELGIETPRPPHMMKTTVLDELLQSISDVVVTSKVKRGRPINPNSNHQIKLRELERRRLSGELHKGKTGRKVNPNSERQKRLKGKLEVQSK